MLIEIFLFLLIGILIGTITGLTPGIHINLVGVIIISLSTTVFAVMNQTYLVVFIVSMAITHTFLDFIPSIFLGCPDTDTELSVLPGHELLKKGHGYQAIILTTYGSLAAIFILIIIAFPAIKIISLIANILPTIIPGLLILAAFFIISTEQNRKKALFVFFLTGMLGLIIFNLENLNQPLLPLLTGLFGGSMLLLSIKNKTEIPKQTIEKPRSKILKPLLGAVIASPICSFLPGLGSGQAAIIGNSISKTDRKGFLVLLGATNTLVMGFSFIALYAISKTRTGAAAAIQDLVGSLSGNILTLILITILITGIIAFFLAKSIAKFASRKITSINYTYISYITLGILTIVVFLVSGFFGLLVLGISTLTGIYCISLKVKRALMMGCLMVPTIILYLF